MSCIRRLACCSAASHLLDRRSFFKTARKTANMSAESVTRDDEAMVGRQRTAAEALRKLWTPRALGIGIGG